MNDLLILPSSVALAIVQSGRNWGTFNVREDPVEAVWVAEGFSRGNESRIVVKSRFLDSHVSRIFDKRPGAGVWYRVEIELHEAWRQSVARDAGLPIGFFQKYVISGWRIPPTSGGYSVLTFCRLDDRVDWCLWWVSAEGAVPRPLEVIEEDSPILTPLIPSWPLQEVSKATFLLVGVGSIGSACAEAVASYGVGRLFLIDPDRLLERNLARHRLDASQLGRFKVTAMADLLEVRFPECEIHPFPEDIIGSANRFRAWSKKADVIIACSDGIASRRTVNHIAAWAKKPALFACVLENGTVGELFRYRPNSGFGCLLCHRWELEQIGSMDPEPTIERDYGQGTSHLPMSAVGGDLALVGEMAGKAAVATYLESVGYRDQMLPGDHSVIGLRFLPALSSPFDVSPGQVAWNAGPTRRPNCPACGEKG